VPFKIAVRQESHDKATCENQAHIEQRVTVHDQQRCHLVWRLAQNNKQECERRNISEQRQSDCECVVSFQGNDEHNDDRCDGESGQWG
jgi:hypothetical protein